MNNLLSNNQSFEKAEKKKDNYFNDITEPFSRGKKTIEDNNIDIPNASVDELSELIVNKMMESVKEDLNQK